MKKSSFRRAAVLAAALAAAGCVDPPPATGSYGGYQPSYRPPVRENIPRSKSVAVANPTVKTVPAAKRGAEPSGAAGGGSLGDIVARIHARDAEKAREAETARRHERDAWLEAHETDLSGVKARLNSMRVFVSMESDQTAKEAVRRAISETEADIDVLRGKTGSGMVGFADASRFRSALQSRHERLLASCPAYKTAMGGK